MQKYPEKIIYYLLFCFSQILPCFVLLQFFNSRACFLFAHFFWQSWETVATIENICFQQRLSGINLFKALTTLISLCWVSYEGSFQVCEGRWWKKIQKCQKLKLGDAPMHPLLHQQSSVRPSPRYIFINSYVMCYAWSVLHLLFSLICFV